MIRNSQNIEVEYLELQKEYQHKIAIWENETKRHQTAKEFNGFSFSILLACAEINLNYLIEHIRKHSANGIIQSLGGDDFINLTAELTAELKTIIETFDCDENQTVLFLKENLKEINFECFKYEAFLSKLRIKLQNTEFDTLERGSNLMSVYEGLLKRDFTPEESECVAVFLFKLLGHHQNCHPKNAHSQLLNYIIDLIKTEKQTRSQSKHCKVEQQQDSSAKISKRTLVSPTKSNSKIKSSAKKEMILRSKPKSKKNKIDTELSEKLDVAIQDKQSNFNKNTEVFFSATKSKKSNFQNELSNRRSESHRKMQDVVLIVQYKKTLQNAKKKSLKDEKSVNDCQNEKSDEEKLINSLKQKVHTSSMKNEQLNEKSNKKIKHFKTAFSEKKRSDSTNKSDKQVKFKMGAKKTRKTSESFFEDLKNNNSVKKQKSSNRKTSGENNENIKTSKKHSKSKRSASTGKKEQKSKFKREVFDPNSSAKKSTGKAGDFEVNGIERKDTLNAVWDDFVNDAICEADGVSRVVKSVGPIECSEKYSLVNQSNQKHNASNFKRVLSEQKSDQSDTSRQFSLMKYDAIDAVMNQEELNNDQSQMQPIDEAWSENEIRSSTNRAKQNRRPLSQCRPETTNQAKPGEMLNNVEDECSGPCLADIDQMASQILKNIGNKAIIETIGELKESRIKKKQSKKIAKMSIQGFISRTTQIMTSYFSGVSHFSKDGCSESCVDLNQDDNEINGNDEESQRKSIGKKMENNKKEFNQDNVDAQTGLNQEGQLPNKRYEAVYKKTSSFALNKEGQVVDSYAQSVIEEKNDNLMKDDQNSNINNDISNIGQNRVNNDNNNQSNLKSNHKVKNESEIENDNLNLINSEISKNQQRIQDHQSNIQNTSRVTDNHQNASFRNENLTSKFKNQSQLSMSKNSIKENKSEFIGSNKINSLKKPDQNHSETKTKKPEIISSPTQDRVFQNQPNNADTKETPNQMTAKITFRNDDSKPVELDHRISKPATGQTESCDYELRTNLNESVLKTDGNLRISILNHSTPDSDLKNIQIQIVIDQNEVQTSPFDETARGKFSFHITKQKIAVIRMFDGSKMLASKNYPLENLLFTERVLVNESLDFLVNGKEVVVTFEFEWTSTLQENENDDYNPPKFEN